MVNRSLKRSQTPLGEAVLASIFPRRRDFRVPVVAVVSDADESDLVRQIARAIGATGLDVVATHGKGYEFGELNFGTGDFATLAGIANAAFAVDSGTSRADRTGSAPQGVDWLAGEQAQTDRVTAGIAERLSAISEKGRPAAAA